MNIFIQIDGVEQGPFSVEDVKRLVYIGKVSLSSLVSTKNDPQWKQLREIPELQELSFRIYRMNQEEHAKPKSLKMGHNPDFGNDSKKKVGLWFCIGIIFLPFIFSWFTLKSGYSNFARIASFSWLGFVVLAQLLAVMNDGNSSSKPLDSRASSYSNSQTKDNKTVISKERFETVADAIEEGAEGQITVNPFDKSQPNKMIIVVSFDTSERGVKSKIRQLATMARDRLGDAVVSVRDEQGNVLAVAGPFGSS